MTKFRKLQVPKPTQEFVDGRQVEGSWKCYFGVRWTLPTNAGKQFEAVIILSRMDRQGGGYERLYNQLTLARLAS